LVNFEPSEEALAMETYATWARLFELQRYYSWIVDRFHLSTRLYQRMHHGRELDFRWLEERLKPLGFHLVFCVRRPETFEQARAERLTVSGNPAQYDDLGIFIREQEEMRGLVAESILPSLELEISDGRVLDAADRIADWMTETGGLWAPP
jgi:thymidylate kinase